MRIKKKCSTTESSSDLRTRVDERRKTEPDAP